MKDKYRLILLVLVNLLTLIGCVLGFVFNVLLVSMLSLGIGCVIGAIIGFLLSHSYSHKFIKFARIDMILSIGFVFLLFGLIILIGYRNFNWLDIIIAIPLIIVGLILVVYGFLQIFNIEFKKSARVVMVKKYDKDSIAILLIRSMSVAKYYAIIPKDIAIKEGSLVKIKIPKLSYVLIKGEELDKLGEDFNGAIRITEKDLFL